MDSACWLVGFDKEKMCLLFCKYFLLLANIRAKMNQEEFFECFFQNHLYIICSSFSYNLAHSLKIISFAHLTR